MAFIFVKHLRFLLNIQTKRNGNHQKQFVLENLIAFITSLLSIFILSYSSIPNETPTTTPLIFSEISSAFFSIPPNVHVFHDQQCAAFFRPSPSDINIPVHNISEIYEVAKHQKVETFAYVEKCQPESFKASFRIVDINWSFSKNQEDFWDISSIDQTSSTQMKSNRAALFLHNFITCKCAPSSLKCSTEVPFHFQNALHIWKQSSPKTLIVLGQASTIICLLPIYLQISRFFNDYESGTRDIMKAVNIHSILYILVMLFINLANVILVQVFFWIPILLYNQTLMYLKFVLPSALLYACNISIFALLVCTLIPSRRIASIAILGLLSLSNLIFLSDLSFSFYNPLFFTNAYYYVLRAVNNPIPAPFARGLTISPIVPIIYLIVDCTLMLVIALIDFIKKTPKSKQASNFQLHHAQTSKVTRNDDNEVLIQLQGVITNLQKKDVDLKNVNLSIFSNKITALYGPLCHGVNTLLQLLDQKIEYSGSITVSGNSFLNNPHRSILEAFDKGFFFGLTVLEHCQLLKKERNVKNIDIEVMLNDLSLLPYITKMPQDLSNIQKKILRLLLCFISNADLILLTDPFDNCNISTRRKICNFIQKHKGAKTIVFTSYDYTHVEDIADFVVFVSNGEVLDSASLTDIKRKHCSNLQLVLWPSRSLEYVKLSEVKNILIDCFGKQEGKKIERKILPNENVVYNLPRVPSAFYSKTLGKIKSIKDSGICLSEIRTPTIHDAYKQCVQLPTAKFDSLKAAKYKMDLLSSFIRSKPTKWILYKELRFVIAQKISFLSKTILKHALHVILPIVLTLLLGLKLGEGTVNRSEIHINNQMFNYMADKYKDIKLTLEYPSASQTDELSGKSIDSTDDCSNFHHSSQIISGFFKGSSIKLCVSQFARFSDFLILQEYYNSYASPRGVSNLTLETIYAPQWRDLIQYVKKQYTGSAIPIPALLGAISENWLNMFIVGMLFIFCTLQASLFMAELKCYNCIPTNFVLGAKAPSYWFSIFFVDFIIFLGLLIISLAVFILPRTCLMSMWITIISCALSYLSAIPIVYISALTATNHRVAYLSAFISLGGILLPILPYLFSISTGPGYEWSVNFVAFMALLFPPLMPAFVNGIYVCNSSNSMQYNRLSSIFQLSALHLCIWFFVFFMYSGSMRRYQNIFEFWLQRKKREFLKFKKANRENEKMKENNKNEKLYRLLSKLFPKQYSGNNNACSLEKSQTNGQTTSIGPTGRTIEQKISEVWNYTKDNVEISNNSLWDLRDKEMENIPVLQVQSVPLSNVSEQSCRLSLFESQSLYLCGDTNESRSTLMELCSAQKYPHSGYIVIDRHIADLQMNIGYVPRDIRLFLSWTGLETIIAFARLNGYSTSKKFAQEFLSILDLANLEDVYVEHFSLSEKKMLSFGLAILSKPSVLLIDDIDMFISPIQAETIRIITTELRDVCKASVMTSCSRICTVRENASHVAIMLNGQIQIGDTLYAITNRCKNLMIFTIVLKNESKKTVIASSIRALFDCDILPHPHPKKIAVALYVNDEDYEKIAHKVHMATTSLKLHDFALSSPDLDSINNAEVEQDIRSLT